MNYARSRENLANPQVFPGLGSGEGFHATLIVTCEQDGLVPPALQFHELLTTAGGDSLLRIEPDSDHGHINEPGHIGAGRTIKAMTEWV